MVEFVKKGQSISFAKVAPGLKKIRVGLGWDASRLGKPADLDVAAFVCSRASGKPKLINDNYLVFYGNPNLADPEKAVVHSGDNRTGDAAGDDETIYVDLTKLNPAVEEIAFAAAIYDGIKLGQSFGKIQNAYIKIYNDETGEEIAVYDLDEQFSTETIVQIGSLVKNNGSWEFAAVGAGYNKELGDFYQAYA